MKKITRKNQNEERISLIGRDEETKGPKIIQVEDQDFIELIFLTAADNSAANICQERGYPQVCLLINVSQIDALHKSNEISDIEYIQQKIIKVSAIQELFCSNNIDFAEQRISELVDVSLDIQDLHDIITELDPIYQKYLYEESEIIILQNPNDLPKALELLNFSELSIAKVNKWQDKAKAAYESWKLLPFEDRSKIIEKHMVQLEKETRELNTIPQWIRSFVEGIASLSEPGADILST